eukprot:maker-scaffold144_size312663-snap-gene-2.43 protein:Tk07282 transcript:maker-scaffold144_size312663-snap-gene-2.43-mRNA-1 annotation:"transmembrane protein 147"
METWRAFHSQDGPDGSRSALRQVLCPANVATRSTMSKAAGDVSLHLPYATNTLVDNGIAMWNKFPALREASTKRMASNSTSADRSKHYLEEVARKPDHLLKEQRPPWVHLRSPMTFYHFGNCLALAYLPYYFTYKFSGLSEYGAFWKCVTAGMLYLMTQMGKMLFLATIFPMLSSESAEDEFRDEETPFEILPEFFKVTVDLVDIFGLYLVLQRMAGKGQVKVLSAGVGWAFAELLLTRVIFLWVGARGIQFDWKYIQASFDANISLGHYVNLACLVWLGSRRDANPSLTPLLGLLLVLANYKTFVLESLVHVFGIGAWTALVYKALCTLSLGFVSMQLFVVATLNDKY